MNTNANQLYSQRFIVNRSLAQLVAHPLDVRKATASSLVSSTMNSSPNGEKFFLFAAIKGSFPVKSYASKHISFF